MGEKIGHFSCLVLTALCILSGRTSGKKRGGIFWKLLPPRKFPLFLTGFPCLITDSSHPLDTHKGKYKVGQIVDKYRRSHLLRLIGVVSNHWEEYIQ